MVRLGARSLAVLGGVYTLVVSVIYTLVVTRRLPAEELAVLTIFQLGLRHRLGHPRIRHQLVPTRVGEGAGALL
jgi:hypothetical protein